ncbi:aspartate transcarbamoylase [Luminiphilus syltensis NOR5-1B]|uniref:Aspartate transcarbamoylase n=1 Tax=Luminiphilus syltensis NOR5-1B TaxID=565045 RepID=B8KX07_9GAMM|nr:aspartate transcarbamoylase [Luminiphilus syltensis NOR5-1B]
MQFPGSHILSIDQFERGDVERVFAVADQMLPYAHRERITRVLEGAILGSMFFEPSTRTRISFGSAFNLLGGEVRETTGFESSSITKGESLYDTARVLSGYSDVIAMRHPVSGAVSEFAEASRVPVLNGGDGANEHPSQALLDLYTIRSELVSRGRSLDGLRIAMVGDLRYGRTVHSLIRLLMLFGRSAIRLVSPRELRMPEAIVAAAQVRGMMYWRPRLWSRVSPTWILSTVRESRRSVSRPAPKPICTGVAFAEPECLHRPLRTQYRHHAPVAEGFPGRGAGTGCRPQRQSQPGDFSTERQRCAGEDGAVCTGAGCG